MKYYERIKLRREELRMSQDTLAERTGYSGKSAISRIEKGEVDVPQTKINEFCNALHVSPNWLLLGVEADGLSPHEKRLIDAYRNAPPLFKKAVDDLLQL
jgi:repressor LexA